MGGPKAAISTQMYHCIANKGRAGHGPCVAVYASGISLMSRMGYQAERRRGTRERLKEIRGPVVK